MLQQDRNIATLRNLIIPEITSSIRADNLVELRLDRLHLDIRLKFTLQETVQHKQVVQLERLFTKKVEKIISLWDLMVEFPRNFWLGNNRKISQFKQSLVCHQHTLFSRNACSCCISWHSVDCKLYICSWFDFSKVYLIMKKTLLLLLTYEEVASTSHLCFLLYLP